MTETFTFNLRPTWMALILVYSVFEQQGHPRLSPIPAYTRTFAEFWRYRFVKGMSKLLCDRAKATYKIPRPSELSPTHDRIQDPHHLIQSFMFKEGGGGGWKEKRHRE